VICSVERRGAGLVQRVVDLIVLGAELGVDQRAGREGQPDLVLGAAMRPSIRSTTSRMAKASSSDWLAK
jgi:hypothetical protein